MSLPSSRSQSLSYVRVYWYQGDNQNDIMICHYSSMLQAGFRQGQSVVNGEVFYLSTDGNLSSLYPILNNLVPLQNAIRLDEQVQQGIQYFFFVKENLPKLGVGTDGNQELTVFYFKSYGRGAIGIKVACRY